MARELVLGLDVGTSSVKALFLEPGGDFVFRDESKLEIFRDGNHAEQNPLHYLAAVKELVARNQGLMNEVIAIGLSGQTPTVVCIDDAGNPTFNALTWQDSRAEKEASDLANQFGNPVSVVGTSLPWSASACPAKLYWLAKNDLNVVKRTRWVLQPKDFVGFALTGKALSDPWSTKGICNVLSREPITQLLDFVGWSSEVMPELADGHFSRGETTKECQDKFGIPTGIPVSVGWSDAMSGMLALGVMVRPTSFIITGTSAIVGSSSLEQPEDGGILYVIPKSCAPLAITYGPTQMSGGSISWMAKLLEVSEDSLISKGAADEKKSAPLYLPYINGERAPLWRNDIRGRFVDLDVAHDQSSLARSVMEGISWAERQVLDKSESITKVKNPAVVLGGHAGNDKRWESIRARTIGRKLLRYEDADTTTRGSAMLAYAMLTGTLEKSFAALSITPEERETSLEELQYANSNYQAFQKAQSSLLADYQTGQER